ncbi:MAK10-like protein [Tanacetum coccineum]
MEGLHNAFADAVGNGLISGININNSSINISHLFFADDVIITTGWNARDLENIIRVLHVFYLASGLKINIHKSNIYGIGVNEDEVYNMASNAGCIAGNIPFNYLGLPIGSNMKSIASWKMLIDRFRSRLSTWKASLLSIGGRLTLIKSVLGSLGIYYLSIFRAPESVLNDLERIRSNFFWGVLKLLTLLFSKNSAGGCSLLQMIYGLKSLKLFMVMKVVLIIMAAVSRDQYWCSKSCFFRDMLNEIGQLNIVASEDTCVWNLCPNGTFTVKDARNIIDQKTLPSNSWDKIIPRKINIFMWRLSLDRLTHRLNLSLRGMDIPAISCSSCNANVESANHIFFECIIASDLWKLVYRPSRKGYRNTIELPDRNNVLPLRSNTIRLVQNRCSFDGLRSEDPNQHLKDFLKLVDSLDLDFANRERARTIDQSGGGKLRDKNAKESWALLKDLTLYENESWNDPRDFAKPVKVISLPQDVPSTSDYHLIELENQVQGLMEAHLAPKSLVQVNKIIFACEICSGPHDTQYCMENLEQTFVDYVSSRTNEAGGKW